MTIATATLAPALTPVDEPRSAPRPTLRWVPWTVAAIAVVAGGFYAWSAAEPALHSFYTAAAVGMSESWSNFLFGSFDTAGWSAIDKIPGSLWPVAASVALFGYSEWSVVIPGVLATVATVVLCYLTAARWRGRIAGLGAAAVYATMPLAAALSKADVPEGWFALTLALSAYLFVRALQSGRFWWLLAAGLGIAAAFQVKMLEAWMLYPAIAVAYLIAAPRGWWTRVWHVVVAGLISITASLWWIVLVTLTPAASRPWVGNTTDNSAWSMVFGYNGFGRVTGSGDSFVADFGGDPGWSRLVGAQVSVDVTWFLPLAVVAGIIAIAAGVGLARARGWDDRVARLRLGGGVFFLLWLVPVALIMAFSAGIHTFYVIAFAPAIAVLIGSLLEDARAIARRSDLRILAVVLIAAQVAWTCWLVSRTDEYGWLFAVVPLVAVAGALLILLGRKAGIAVAFAGLLLAPLMWTVSTVGSMSASNPSASDVTAGPGGGSGSGSGLGSRDGRSSRGGPGDGDDNTSSVADLSAWLQQNAGDAKYVVAADSSTSGELVLAGTPGVIATSGSYRGNDPTPTAAQLAAIVQAGDLRYVLLGDGGSSRGGRSSSDSATAGVTAEREAWVQANCAVVDDAPTTSGTLYRCDPAT